MFDTPYIEISKSALENNLRFLKKILGKRVKLSSVVKANAYGHGIEQFVPLAEDCGIDHFAVFNAEEASRVYRVARPETDIMIMGWADTDELAWAIGKGIEFYVFDNSKLENAIKLAEKMKKKAKIHLEIETGMNRTGLNTRELPKTIRLIREHKKNIRLKGLCTHFAGAESIANHVRVQRQFRNFQAIARQFAIQGVKPGNLHTASSAAAISYPKTRLGMVRVGILQYGFWPSRETFIHYIHRRKDKTDPLHRILSWKSRVMTVKTVKQGEFVSYGTTYLATEKKRIAVIPTGYAHGFSRSLSNLGRVLIRGQRVGVIGMVNMNMLIADVTGIQEVRQGDEVVLIGKQADTAISVSSFSELSDQLNYESLVRLPESTKRIITN